MRVYIRMKEAGRRKDVLQPTPWELPEGIGSLRQLLTVITELEVSRYNGKSTRTVSALTAEQLDSQADAGKVSFGSLFSDEKADREKAVANAVQCWQDGLVRVFMNGAELTELDAPLSIPEDAEFTFIRLTFLAGRMW